MQTQKKGAKAHAGQIVLLSGLRKATTGDTLCAMDGDEVPLESIDTKEPVLGLAIEADSSKDEEKMLEAIAKICEEDPLSDLKKMRKLDSESFEVWANCIYQSFLSE